MKQNLLTILLCSFIFISATTIQTLTQRSKEQIVFHSNDLNQLTKIINDYYKIGYRVTETAPQSISVLSLRDGRCGGCANEHVDFKGEILVIMER